jgi:hypothetical protein
MRGRGRIRRSELLVSLKVVGGLRICARRKQRIPATVIMIEEREEEGQIEEYG